MTPSDRFPIPSLFPQTDIIGAMVIVWRVRGKIISSVLCNIVRHNCAQCNAHMNRPNSSLAWVLSHWAHFTVLRFIFMVAIYNRADHYIFALWFLSIFYLFYSSPNLSGHILDVYHTSTHGVALVAIFCIIFASCIFSEPRAAGFRHTF